MAQVARDAEIINFNEARGPDPGFRHRWLDRLQDDPRLPRQSVFGVAYAVARFVDAKAATPKVWASIAKIAARAQVPVSTAKADLKWLHDHGWLTFGAGHFKTKVRVLMMPGTSSHVADRAATSQPDMADRAATDLADRAATMNTTSRTPPEDYHQQGPLACARGARERDPAALEPDERSGLAREAVEGGVSQRQAAKLLGVAESTLRETHMRESRAENARKSRTGSAATKAHRAKTSARGKRPLPPDWQPPPDAYALADQCGQSVPVIEGKFRDWCAASGKLYADHDAAFRLFITRERSFERGGGRSHPPGRGSIVGAFDRDLERRESEIASKRGSIVDAAKRASARLQMEIEADEGDGVAGIAALASGIDDVAHVGR